MPVPGEVLLVLAENLLLDAQFPGRLLVADQEASGLTVDKVANARRHPGDRWQATTANADHTITLTTDELRAASCLVIDRASNHLGKRFVLETSNDAFVTVRTVFDVTLPLVPGGQPGDALGCVTDEGAWIKTFPTEAAYGWRLTSKAMGAGIVPQLTGVWLGLAWQPVNLLLNYPSQDEAYAVASASTVSPYGWRGRFRPAVARSGQLVIDPGDEAEFDLIRYHLLGLMGVGGFPAWICWDRASGGRKAFLGSLPDSTTLDLSRVKESAYRRLTLPFLEEQPLP
jgi:hypothetical protein